MKKNKCMLELILKLCLDLCEGSHLALKSLSPLMIFCIFIVIIGISNEVEKWIFIIIALLAASGNAIIFLKEANNEK